MGRIFASEIGGSFSGGFIFRGLFSEFYGIGLA